MRAAPDVQSVARQLVADLMTVLSEFSEADLSLFLSFSTGLANLPAGGFSALDPPFTVAVVRADRGDSTLPTSHTCFNMILVPAYGSIDALRQQLLFAVRNTAAGDFGTA